jgi:hypothetical protein
MRTNNGRHPASNSPRKKRKAIIDEKLGVSHEGTIAKGHYKPYDLKRSESELDLRGATSHPSLYRPPADD